MKALVKAHEDSSRGLFSRASNANNSTSGVEEMANPLADASTFEVEGPPTSTGDVIEAALAGTPLPDDQESDEEHGDLDTGFDKKTRRIVSAALKADRDNAAAVSMFLKEDDESRFGEILLDNLRYI
eukprot:COSAG06_NODE_8542_length_2135_cov_0.999018_2_plen_127_part_00